MTILIHHSIHNRLVRGFRLALLAGLLLLPSLTLDLPPAAAQELSFIQEIVNPRLTVERNRTVRTAVKAAVGRRLAPMANGGVAFQAGIEPAGMIIAPAANVETDAAQTRWSAWVDGSYTNIDENHSLRAFTSDQSGITTGLDRQFTDRFLLGVIFNYSNSDTQNIFLPGSSTTDNYSAGPYIGLALTDNIVFDASFLYTWSDNAVRQTGGASAAYDSESWNFNANVTGYWYFDNLRVSPSAGVSYSRSRDESYVDSAAFVYASEVTRVGTMNFGTTLAYTVNLDDTRTAEPYVTVAGEWEFENSVSPAIATGLPTDTRDLDARVEAGVELGLVSNVTLTLNGSIGGLARSRYQTLTGGGRVSISF